MKKSYLPLIAALALCAASARADDAKILRVSIANTLDTARPNAPIVLSVAGLKKAAPDFDPANFVVYDTQQDPGTFITPPGALPRPLPFQADDLDGDGKPDEIAFECDLPPKAARMIQIAYGKPEDIAPLRFPFPKRAHASYQQKYEGMGWESDRVGWRMYFDERNAFDMWGKKQHAMLLDYFALPGVDYHSESPLGRDTYKIGDALGIGSVGAYVKGKTYKVSKVESRTWKVVADGPVRAIADLVYKGWDVGGRKVDLTSRLTVWAGHHWFDHEITVTKARGLTIVTGLPVKPAKDVTFEPLVDDPHVYGLTTWGRQVLEPGATSTEALPDHNMGLAVFLVSAPNNANMDLPDAENHLIAPISIAGDGKNLATWRVVSAWDEEEPDGDSVAGINLERQMPRAVQTQKAWLAYVKDLVEDARNPVMVRVLSRMQGEGKR